MAASSPAIPGEDDDSDDQQDHRCSYSFATAERIDLLSSVIRQTVLMVDESRSLLEASLSSQEKLTAARIKLEAKQMNVIRVRNRLKKEEDLLQRLKRIQEEENDKLSQQREDIMEKFQGLKDARTSLNDQRSRNDN